MHLAIGLNAARRTSSRVVLGLAALAQESLQPIAATRQFGRKFTSKRPVVVGGKYALERSTSE
jgi:hypothetical protein